MSVGSATIPDFSTPPLELPADVEPENPLWRFALAFWKHPDVQNSCLALQNQGWSVTRILSAAWLALSGRVFAGVEDATVTEWRNRVTVALRSARKSLPGNADTCHKLRTGIAGLELEAEQIELALSWRTLMINNPENTDMQGRDALIITNLVAAAPTSFVDDSARPLLNTLAETLAHFPKGDLQP
ncbi:TIGR02444 family protein [Marinobacter maroccanus]|uniref:TIGR02444 family protein n=1 Tax=Marinobacter maroccanus TaxID=2055143 RepID=A0A2S5ZA48_9GAMM|nr:TIGR02444 family protein [Marinobacter maroccanus]PPI84094.1 TIGR02444 family protein [Marinobacter maroccanus]